ncbi:hypothetical protein D3C84_677260 [compost metagenome]
MLHIRLAVEHLHDLLDVRIQQQVVVGFLLEQAAGVDELGGGVGLVFGQHQNVHGDGGAVEQIGRERDHAFHIVVVHQVLADLLLGSAPVEDAGEADNGGAAFGREVAKGVQHKGEVGLGFGRQHAGRGKAVVVDQGRVVRPLPLHRVRWVGDDGIEGFVIAEMGGAEGVAQLDIEFVVVDVVQEHVHPRQVVGGVVEFLTEKAVFDDVGVEVLLGLQQQRARAAGRVVDFVDRGLLVHGELGYQLGDMLRGEELATGFTGIGGVVGDEVFVGIAKQVDMAFVKGAKIQLCYAFEHVGQTGVFILHRIAQTVAGGVEVGKQAPDVALRRVAVGRAFNRSKDASQVGVQALVAVGTGRHLGE